MIITLSVISVLQAYNLLLQAKTQRARAAELRVLRSKLECHKLVADFRLQRLEK